MYHFYTFSRTPSGTTNSRRIGTFRLFFFCYCVLHDFISPWQKTTTGNGDLDQHGVQYHDVHRHRDRDQNKHGDMDLYQDRDQQRDQEQDGDRDQDKDADGDGDGDDDELSQDELSAIPI